MDSIPSSSSPVRFRRRQSARMPSRKSIRSASPPCVKHNFLVKDVRELRGYDQEGLSYRQNRPPGPVVVDIPKDITAHTCEFEYPQTVQMRSYNPVVKGPSGADQEGCAVAVDRQTPDHLCRWWCGVVGRVRQLTRARTSPRLPGHQHADGPRCLQRYRPQFLGMLGMHGTVEGQHGDALRRRDSRHRCALRRPRRRQSGELC